MKKNQNKIEQKIKEYKDNIKFLTSLRQEDDYRRKWEIDIENLDKTNYENNFEWNKYDDEVLEKKLAEFDELTIEDILQFENPEIIFFRENLSAEVISFNSILKIKDFYIKFDVYDTLSPNRWYNLPSEDHLDHTSYFIMVNVEYSQNKKLFEEEFNLDLKKNFS